jgi:hypothetical protein
LLAAGYVEDTFEGTIVAINAVHIGVEIAAIGGVQTSSVEPAFGNVGTDLRSVCTAKPECSATEISRTGADSGAVHTVNIERSIGAVYGAADQPIVLRIGRATDIDRRSVCDSRIVRGRPAAQVGAACAAERW